MPGPAAPAVVAAIIVKEGIKRGAPYVVRGAKWAGGKVVKGAKWAGGKAVDGAKWAGGKAKKGLDRAKKWWKGDKKKKDKKKDEQCATGTCKRKEDHPEGAKPGRKTKGKTKQYEKNGGQKQMDKDFDGYNPTDVTTKQTSKGPVSTGRLSDGRTITKRGYSSEGRPTLEIRRPNGRGAETRYNP